MVKVRMIGSSLLMIAEEICRCENELLEPSVIIVGRAVWSDLHSHLTDIDKISIFINGSEPLLYGLRVIESKICEMDEFFVY